MTYHILLGQMHDINKPMQYTTILKALKMTVLDEKEWYFLIFTHGYSLELPHCQGDFNEYPNHKFMGEKENILLYLFTGLIIFV